MKRKFLMKLGLLSLACGISFAAPVSIIHAEDTTQPDSTATLTLDSSDTHLSLDAVPNFPFGTVKTGDILSGQTLTASLSDNNKVTVTDTRLDAKDWQLTVTPTAFTNNSKTNNGKKIAGTLSLTPGDFDFTDNSHAPADGWEWKDTSLTLPGNEIEVASSNGDQEGQVSATISAATFKTTSHNALASGTYTSTLTWDLTGTPDTSASE